MAIFSCEHGAIVIRLSHKAVLAFALVIAIASLCFLNTQHPEGGRRAMRNRISNKHLESGTVGSRASYVLTQTCHWIL